MEEKKGLKAFAIKKRPSVTYTLESIEVGDSVLIKREDIKTPSILTAARRLKDKGYVFKVSEKDLINETLVTRLK